MNKFLVFLFSLVLLACSNNTKPSASGFIDDKLFANPPQSSKIHTWWHWMDGNISKQGITKDLEAMKQQGIVQATILNIGLLGDTNFGVKKVDFASPEWYDMFEWALHEAHRLGITIGVHNCDGWSTSGGPWINPENAMKEYTWTKNRVSSAHTGMITLKKPLAFHNFYKDVAVVAVRSNETENSFHQAHPRITQEGKEVDFLTDGCPVSALAFKNGDALDYRFDKEFTAEKITLVPRKAFLWEEMDYFRSTFRVSVSDDGQLYWKISEFTLEGLNSVKTVSIPKTTAKYFRLELLGTNNLSGWLPFYIGECEFLSGNEKPLFWPDIDHFSEKAGSVKITNKNIFDVPVDDRKVIVGKEIVDLTHMMNPDGTLDWAPPKGNWTIYRFGYTVTDAVNSPATKSGEGLECDKMDTSALNFHFNNFAGKLIQHAGSLTGNTFRFILVDSWECRFQNWTAGMSSEFEKLNGYALVNYIPVLCGETSGSTEIDEAVLYDLRKTIAHLVETNYYKHFGELLHRNSLELHAEVIYGGKNYPSLNILKTTQYVDLPMFEFWSSTNNRQEITYYPMDNVELNMPACAVVGYEKPILGSEAFTGMAHYSEYPEVLKPFGDRAFCTGINQMILHSYVHQPTDAKPGLTLGEFGSHFNRNNTCWNMNGGWFTYQARLQYILQKGYRKQDVLYFLGDQLPQFLEYNRSNKLPFGYSFNACNADILKNRIEVKNGKLVLNHKNEYSLLCLSENTGMEYQTLLRLAELVKSGIIVYGKKPQQTLSLTDVKNNQEAFGKLTDQIWGNVDGINFTSNQYGKGKVYWGISLEKVLTLENIAPDVVSQPGDELNLMFIHKQIGNEDVYFVMNQQNDTLIREIAFRVGIKTPEIWDAESGTISSPAVFITDNIYTTLPVTLKPYQALLFVFKNGKPENYITQVKLHGNPVFPASKNAKPISIPYIRCENGHFVSLSDVDSTYQMVDNKNKTIQLSQVESKTYLISEFTAKVKFDAGYGTTIQDLSISTLNWLSESENPQIKYFSGTACYTLNFKFPATEIKPKDSLLIDIGAYGSIAELTLNGSNVGIIWEKGQKLQVNGLLKENNTLEIKVTNTYRNRFIGDFNEFGNVKNLSTSSPVAWFLNKNSGLSPSGLKGPIQIIRIRKPTID